MLLFEKRVLGKSMFETKTVKGKQRETCFAKKNESKVPPLEDGTNRAREYHQLMTPGQACGVERFRKKFKDVRPK